MKNAIIPSRRIKQAIRLVVLLSFIWVSLSFGVGGGQPTAAAATQTVYTFDDPIVCNAAQTSCTYQDLVLESEVPITQSDGKLNVNKISIRKANNAAFSVERLVVPQTTSYSLETFLAGKSVSKGGWYIGDYQYYDGFQNIDRIVIRNSYVPTFPFSELVLDIPGLDPPTGLHLSNDSLLAWQPVNHADTYKIKMVSSSGGADVTYETEEPSYDILSIVRSKGAATYSFNVVSADKSGIYRESPRHKFEYVIVTVEQAAQPVGLLWTGQTASWDAVSKATAYSVQLYKNGTSLGSPVQADVTQAITGIDFSEAILAGGYGTYTFTVKAIGNDRLVLDSAVSNQSTSNIVLKWVQLTGISATKVYDGTTTATVDYSQAVLDGVESGHIVYIQTGDMNAQFADAKVGENKQLSLTGLTLSGADAGKYVWKEPIIITADITPKPIQATSLIVKDKVYDGTTDGQLDLSALALSGVLPGDDVELLSKDAKAAFADERAGDNKPVSITGLGLTGADAGNYVLAPVTVTANIKPKEVTATGIVASSKQYDGNTDTQLDAKQAKLVGTIAGDDVELLSDNGQAAFADKKAGDNKPVSVTGLLLTGTDADNYTLTPITDITANIEPKEITVEGIAASSKRYDDNTDAQLDVKQAKLAGTIDGDNVQLDTSQATGDFADKNVGVDKTVSVSGLSLSGTDAENYRLSPYVTKASITAGEGGGGGGTSQPPKTESPENLPYEADIRMNGEARVDSKITHSVIDGRMHVNALVDADKLIALLREAKAQAQLTFDFKGENIAEWKASLTGQALAELARNRAAVTLESREGFYTLSSDLLWDAMRKQFHDRTDEELSRAILEISLGNPSVQQLQQAGEALTAAGAAQADSILHYGANVRLEGKEYELSDLGSYAQHGVYLELQGNEERRTGVVLESDGAIRPVPTKTLVRGGRTAAVMSSRTNSFYAVTQFHTELTDIDGHWAKSAINDMASRFVVRGDANGRFQPEQPITRAEFAAVAVRALGLKAQTAPNAFSDITKEAWYAQSVATAQAYGLIQGFEDGSFRPNDTITREQAAKIWTLALEVTGVRQATTTPDQAAELLSAFKDADSVSQWARVPFAEALQAGLMTGKSGEQLDPKGFATKAEVAVMAQRLLQKSGLIE
ncbi:YDG domain-containing protein [Paenibacillus sp. NPDC058071]|uniref:YDG domain-containing protein n=1 Tax=Paenibacillus sp. NPDC058071 TaxID=3346326 RepID=UPI0036DE35C9